MSWVSCQVLFLTGFVVHVAHHLEGDGLLSGCTLRWCFDLVVHTRDGPIHGSQRKLSIRLKMLRSCISLFPRGCWCLQCDYCSMISGSHHTPMSQRQWSRCSLSHCFCSAACPVRPPVKIASSSINTSFSRISGHFHIWVYWTNAYSHLALCFSDTYTTFPDHCPCLGNDPVISAFWWPTGPSPCI